MGVLNEKRCNIDPELYLNIFNSLSPYMTKFNSNKMSKSIVEEFKSLKKSVHVRINNNNKSVKKNLSKEFEKNYKLYEYNSLFILQYKFTKNNKENIDENSFEIITKTKFMEYKDESFKYLEKDLKSNKNVTDKTFQQELYIKYKYEFDKLNFFLGLDKEKIINIFKKFILNKNKNQNINLLPSLIIESLNNKNVSFKELKRINNINNIKIPNKDSEKIMETIAKFSGVLDFSLPNENKKKKYDIIKKINVEPKYFLDFTFEIDSGYIYNKEKLIIQKGGIVEPISGFIFGCTIIFYIACFLVGLYFTYWFLLYLSAIILNTKINDVDVDDILKGIHKYISRKLIHHAR